MAAEKNALKDLIAFASLVVAIIGLGFVMRGVQSYLSDDWGSVSACRTNYWQCRSEFTGMSLGQRGSMSFRSDAKDCKQMRAYDSALRRARLECNRSPSVRRNSCREVSTLCDLPNSHQYY